MKFREFLELDEKKGGYVTLYIKGKNEGTKKLEDTKEQRKEFETWIRKGGDIKFNGKLYNDPDRISDFYK